VKLQSVHSRACLFCSLFCCRRKCKISPHCCCRQFHRFASRCPLPFLQSGPRNRRVSCIERRLCSMVWVGAQPVRSLNKDHSLASCIGERNLAPKRRNGDTQSNSKTAHATERAQGKAAQQASNTGWSVHPRELHTRVALRLPVAWCVVSWRPNQSLRRRRKPMRRPPPCLNQPRRKGLHRRPLKAQTQSRRQAHPCQASALRYPREVRVA
jgi:hypothetical protein